MEGRTLTEPHGHPLLESLAFEQFHRDERWIGADIGDGRYWGGER